MTVSSQAWTNQHGSGLSLKVDMPSLASIERGMQEAPSMVNRELLAMMTVVTRGLEGEVQDAMPAVSGLTRASIASDAYSAPAGVLGTVGSSQPAALFVELGTKPHMPPVEALVPWVIEVLGVQPARARAVAFLVARKIARRGTPAQFPFKKTLERMRPQLVREFESAAGRIARQLGGAT